MVKPTLAVVADAMHLDEAEKDSLAFATREFLKHKYNDNAAKIAGLNLQQLGQDARLFLKGHGSDLFCQTGQCELRWPRDEAKLVEHITEWMGVQSDNQRRRAKGTRAETPEKSTEDGLSDSPGSVEDTNDLDYQQTDISRVSVPFNLHYTRGTAPKRPTREAALVPSIEPASALRQGKKRNGDTIHVTSAQNMNKRMSFDRVIIPENTDSRRIANRDHEASVSHDQETIVVREVPVNPSFGTKSNAIFGIDNSLHFPTYTYDQSMPSYRQLTPPGSLNLASHDLEQEWTIINGQDEKPSMPRQTNSVIDMTAEIRFYLGEGRERSLSKEQVPKVFQRFLDLLYDRSDESEQGRRSIRDAQSYQRAKIGQEAQHITKILNKMWVHPLWDED